MRLSGLTRVGRTKSMFTPALVATSLFLTLLDLYSKHLAFDIFAKPQRFLWVRAVIKTAGMLLDQEGFS